MKRLIFTKVCVLVSLTLGAGVALSVPQAIAPSMLTADVEDYLTQLETGNFPSGDQGQPDEKNTAAGAGGWRA